ncbi:MAG TPA: NrfD/PsrC family molybdoenzyme membrane anchor subunit [Burkholderiales bacterium]|nr:NrfD/PsrC family molybdoenzyme membrane anchor subunit [Burkholderiales bacterium]
MAQPRNLIEVAQYLLALWREEGTLRFLRIALDLGHRKSIAGRMWFWGLVVGLASLAFVSYMLITEGGAAFNTSSDGVNWGMAISTYVFFALTSSGLTFIASLPMVFGFREFYPIAKRCLWLAIITLGAGFSVLALELGHPFRMLWVMPANLQYLSPMFWMGVFYLIDLVLLLVKFDRLWHDDWDSPLSQALAVGSFVAVLLASGMLGLVFGSMVMRPMWYGSFTAVFFILTAALSGAAAIVLAVYFAYGFRQEAMPEPLRSMASGAALPKVFATLIGIALVSVVLRMWTGLWSNLDGLEGFHDMARSPAFHVELWLGLALPFALMLAPRTQRSARWQITASALVLLGLFIERYEFLIRGQVVPMFKGAWASGLTVYTPSATEWAMTVLGFAIVFAFYGLGEKLFDLSAVPPSERLAGAAPRPAVQP